MRDAGKVLQGKTKQYVFVSTVSVYASHARPGADEGDALAEYTGADAMAETAATLEASGYALYGPLKARSEQEAAKWFPGQTTVVRPGLIVGPGDDSDRFTYWPVRLARGGEVLAPGDGSDLVQLIDARDLAEWTIRLVEQRTIGTFNGIGPGHPLTMEEMLHGIRAATTAGARLVWVPADFLAEQQVSPWSDMPVWVPASGDMAGFGSRSNRAAIAAGLTFRPLARTALDTLDWWAALPAERQAALKAGLPPEREKQVLAAWEAKRKGAGG